MTWLTTGMQYLTFGESTVANRGWQEILTPALVATNLFSSVTEKPMIALGSTTTLYWTNNLPPALASFSGSGHSVQNILVNLGLNDVAGAVDQATFQTRFGSILDAFHARFPDALVFVAHVWGRTYDAQVGDYNSSIDTIVAARAAWAKAGLDSPTVIKGNDNGATNTTDGTHYTAAGNSAAASAWQTAMGF